MKVRHLIWFFLTGLLASSLWSVYSVENDSRAFAVTVAMLWTICSVAYFSIMRNKEYPK